MKLHLEGTFGFTACGMHHQQRLKRRPQVTQDTAKVTCGLCKRSPTYRNRIAERTIREVAEGSGGNRP